MKKTLLTIMLVATAYLAHAQQYFTKSGHVSFFSATPLENIEAHNYKSSSVIDVSTGQIQINVLMKAFEFQKALMQEHFNENYVESNEYPSATFNGKIVNLKDVNFSKDGVYNVKAAGKLTIHGVTREVEIPATLTIKGGKITNGNATFNVTPQDYKIEIPSVVKEKIAKQIKVTVDLPYQEFIKK